MQTFKLEQNHKESTGNTAVLLSNHLPIIYVYIIRACTGQNYSNVK